MPDTKPPDCIDCGDPATVFLNTGNSEQTLRTLGLGRTPLPRCQTCWERAVRLEGRGCLSHGEHVRLGNHRATYKQEVFTDQKTRILSYKKQWKGYDVDLGT